MKSLRANIILVAAGTAAPLLIAVITIKLVIPHDSSAAGWWLMRMLPYIAGLSVVTLFLSLLVVAGSEKD